MLKSHYLALAKYKVESILITRRIELPTFFNLDTGASPNFTLKSIVWTPRWNCVYYLSVLLFHAPKKTLEPKEVVRLYAQIEDLHVLSWIYVKNYLTLVRLVKLFSWTAICLDFSFWYGSFWSRIRDLVTSAGYGSWTKNKRAQSSRMTYSHSQNQRS